VINHNVSLRQTLLHRNAAEEEQSTTSNQARSTWKRVCGKKMWTADFRDSCRKVKAVAQYRVGWRQLVCGRAGKNVGI